MHFPPLANSAVADHVATFWTIPNMTPEPPPQWQSSETTLKISSSKLFSPCSPDQTPLLGGLQPLSPAATTPGTPCKPRKLYKEFAHKTPALNSGHACSSIPSTKKQESSSPAGPRCGPSPDPTKSSIPTDPTSSL